MSEKGGKDYSLLSKGGGSLKGKDDSASGSGSASATKSARGRKVQFSKESMSPFDSRVNSPMPSGKGDYGKGGKPDKVANGGKGSASKDSEHSIDEELPKNIKCLMDSEAAVILQGIQDNMVTLSRDASIKIPVSFDKGLHYAKSSNKYLSPESVKPALEHLVGYGLTDSEICVIANVCPSTAEEAFALLPSLKGRRSITSQVLEDAVSDLAKLKQPM